MAMAEEDSPKVDKVKIYRFPLRRMKKKNSSSFSFQKKGCCPLFIFLLLLFLLRLLVLNTFPAFVIKM